MRFNNNISRHISLFSLGLFLVSIPSTASARLDPMGVISERLQRAEVAIVLDTSGSMAWSPSPSNQVGSDCGGDREGKVDICGDGMCSGAEGSNSNPCSTDCNINNAYSHWAGSPRQCNPSKVQNSRMFMVKRVLRNLLPDLRRSVSFGMVTFKQSGYHRYHMAGIGPTRKVSIFLSRLELERLGAWNISDSAPSGAFQWSGTGHTLLSGAGLSTNKDSLYARIDNTGIERRFRFSSAGMLHTTNNGRNWSYRGSYYTYAQAPTIPFISKVSEVYRGPQYVDGDGVRWVHHRFDQSYSAQGISSGASGTVAVPFSASEDQSDIGGQLFTIIGKLNTARNGGIWAWGGTPTGPAIQTAEGLFTSRQKGTGPYLGAGADPQAACRPRFVLLLTDGQSNSGIDPGSAARNLYNNSLFSQNPIRTLVVGLPGLPGSAVAELDRVADLGDDGKANQSKTALVASDEAALNKVLKEVLFEIVQGDYTTTEPAVTSWQSSYTQQGVAVIPSTEYPGWRGQVRALDLTKSPAEELWSAGTALANIHYYQRAIFSGLPSINGGAPVRLMDNMGVVNVDGSCAGCNGVGLKQLWSEVGTPPPDGEIRSVVEWLAGKGRAWKLPPIMHSTPAVVGPPPKYGMLSHQGFRAAHVARERLIYVASNEGLLHALRSEDGSEAFAFLVPDALPALHRLWQHGGQDADPSQFRWILASSPRVEDVPSSAAHGWSTHLVLTMGPGGEEFIALDVTDPSSCIAGICALKQSPFSVVAHSRALQTSSVMGETWSVPVMFYDYDAGSETPTSQMAMGSGYGKGNEGHFYNHFSKLYNKPASTQHSAGGAEVEFALLGSTAAAVDLENRRDVIASYVADPAGRIARYHRGEDKAGTVLINQGGKSPFYFTPALFHAGNDRVILAAASMAQDDDAPPGGAVSRLVIRSEVAGTVDPVNDNLTCAITDICSQAVGCPDEIPSGCTAPSSRARPVARPLIIDNQIGSGISRYEVYYLMYEESATACGEGSSWLIRVATDGSTQQLVSATRYTGVRATGITPVGQGQDLAITHTGVKGKKSTAFTVLNNMSTGGFNGVLPYVEVWKEVQ